jgi:hypothetical protein
MMLDDRELADRISEAIRWDGEDGSWADVQARALQLDATREAERSHARGGLHVPRRGRSLLIAIGLVLVGGSIAFALGDQIVSALNPPPYRPPAPRTPQESMRDFSRSFVSPAIGGPPSLRRARPGSLIPGTTRLLISLQTRRFGRVLLYGARAQHGLCFVIVRDGRSSGQCSSDRVPMSSPIVFGHDTSPERPGFDLVEGHSRSAKARALRIRFQRGASRVVLITSRFFLFELAPDHSSRSTDPPVAFEVLDAAGHTLGTRRDPFRLERTPASAVRPIGSSIRLLARATIPHGAGRVTISSGRDTNGHSCLQVVLNGHSALETFTSWQCNASVGHYAHQIDSQNPRLFHQVPVSWTLGRSGNTPVSSHTFAYGWVAPTITRLEVRFQDGRAAAVPLHHGYFLYVIPPANWLSSHRPRMLQAYTATGELTYRQFLYPLRACVYPGPGAACGSTSSGSTTFVVGASGAATP